MFCSHGPRSLNLKNKKKKIQKYSQVKLNVTATQSRKERMNGRVPCWFLFGVDNCTKITGGESSNFPSCGVVLEHSFQRTPPRRTVIRCNRRGLKNSLHRSPRRAVHIRELSTIDISRTIAAKPSPRGVKIPGGCSSPESVLDDHSELSGGAGVGTGTSVDDWEDDGDRGLDENVSETIATYWCLMHHLLKDMLT